MMGVKVEDSVRSGYIQVNKLWVVVLPIVGAAIGFILSNESRITTLEVGQKQHEKVIERLISNQESLTSASISLAATVQQLNLIINKDQRGGKK